MLCHAVSCLVVSCGVVRHLSDWPVDDDDDDDKHQRLITFIKENTDTFLVHDSSPSGEGSGVEVLLLREADAAGAGADGDGAGTSPTKTGDAGN